MTMSRAAAGGDTADATPESGIVWIYHFQPDGPPSSSANEAVERALADHVGWTWVHLSLADTRCRAWIAQNAPLSELARETLLGPDEHLRLDVLGHEIVGVVPDLQQEFAQASDAIVRLRFVMTERHADQRAPHAGAFGGDQPPRHRGRQAFPDRGVAARRRHRPVRRRHRPHGRAARQRARRRRGHVMHDEPADQRPRIGRVRLQAVRVHRQLAQLRGMFHRLEPRMAAEHAGGGAGDRARWRRSSTPSTTRSARCTSAPGCCSTRWRPR